MAAIKISATNIELLIRNPFAFFHKNILNLRKLSALSDRNNLSHFGNLVHKIIEAYLPGYEDNMSSNRRLITELAKQIGEASYSSAQLNLWWPKLLNITHNFIEFDHQRRAHLGVKVFAEVSGNLALTINEQAVIITAIADRIELAPDGKIYILDYKTGTLPSKQDVLSGLSPQLIVEALIANAGGFNLERPVTTDEIIYVKFTSRPPYIDIIKYDVDSLDLGKHALGLERVLSYYLQQEHMPKNHGPHAPKYDDYKHLARKQLG